jgi:two-component system, response regulator
MIEADTKPDVLVVEEDEAIAELYLNALQTNALASRVVWIRSAAEARDFLCAQGQYEGRNILDRPRVIFIEIRNSAEDGHGFIRAIKSDERLKRIPVVALTTSKTETDLAEYYKNGGNSFVMKPDSPEEIKELMKQIGRYWLSVNRSSN